MTKRFFIGRKSQFLPCFGWALVLLPALLLSCTTAWAKPTTPAQARRVVETWLSLDPRPLGAGLGGQVLEVQSFPPAAAAPDYFIVSLKPQGFVVVPADDLVEPLIAFIPQGSYDPSADNPLGALVSQEVPGRVAQVREMASQAQMEGLKFSPPAIQEKARLKWQLLDTPGMAAGTAPGTAPLTGLPDISDVRVPPLLQSTWNQYNWYGLCYNYYTPDNYRCGCMATAMAQLMRYHTFPTAGVGTTTFDIQIDDVPATANLRGGNGGGGPYDWGNMALTPDASTTDLQRQAIGALTYDAGVSVNMDYRNGSSLAYFRDTTTALVSTFGYANACNAYNSNLNIPTASLYPMINPNLDAALPVMLQIRSGSIGHAVVADGYGYDLDTLYHHLNMGWSGQDDAWYNLPTIDTTSRLYSVIDRCGYNIYPSGSGEIISGRVTNAGGSPIYGAEVVATRTGGGVYTASSDNRGIYALAKVPSASGYTIQVTKAGYAFTSQVVATGTSVNNTLTVGNLWGIDFTGTGGPQGFLPPVYQLLLN